MVATGLAVFLIIEIGGLIFVDRSYLADNTGDTKVDIVTNNVSKTGPSLKVNIDSSATDIKASYDGSYLAYKLNGSLQVLNLVSGEVLPIKMDENMELGYYDWVYDRDQLIIAEIAADPSQYYAKLYNLNIKENATPAEIMNTVNTNGKPTAAKILLSSKNVEVTDLDFSTVVVASYLKLTNKYSGNSTAWEFNLPSANRSYKNLSTYNIGKIQCLKDTEGLLYENDDNGRVYVAGEGSLNIDGNRKFRLLGYDGSDNIYLSSGDGKTTKEILYGSIEKQDDNGEISIDLTPDLTKITLSKAMDIKNIYVTLTGGIYYNDSENSVFKNLVTAKEIAYHGELKSVFGKGFITVNDGVVIQNSLD
jgi:hypothetical protein